MSTLRKRQTSKQIDAQKIQAASETVVDRIRESAFNVLFNRGDKNIQRIESSSFLKPLLLFIVVFGSSVYFVRYLHSLHDDVMAGHLGEYTRLFVEVPCSGDYGVGFPKCAPKKCGRSVRDNLFDRDHLLRLRQVAEKGLALGGGSGGASILDLHSGALSYKDKFINIFKFEKPIFSEADFKLYTDVKNRILSVIAAEFAIDASQLYLTRPTFFSRMNATPAVTKHDEYWHPHVDRVTYGTFFYTSLLYLSTYSEDFTGGRFVFVDSPCNKTVEPRFGRLSFFTSGSENEHFVERVESGTRFALTVSFTCDKRHAISDPSWTRPHQSME